MEQPKSKLRLITLELIHHLPYSIFGVVAAIIMMGILTFIAKVAGADTELAHNAEELFHIFHPSHVLFSAVATTAMFWKHDNNNILKAMAIGFIGSVAICGVSDIIIPFLGGMILGHDMYMHICLIEEPHLVLPFAATGVVAGLVVPQTFERSTQYSHSVHVFLSSSASLIYLISFGLVDWMHALAGVFFVTVAAVMFPCCLSDIVFPLVCTHKFCHHTE